MPCRFRLSPSRRRRRRLSLVAPVLLLLFALPLPADAQYFGRNKVQYDDFDFEVLRTDHFDLHFYEEEAAAARDAARMAERWYERLARTFQHGFRQRKPLIFYANSADFQQTNTIGSFISQATGGVTEGVKNRVIMPFAETWGETDHVLGHELVHAFQFDLAQARSGAGATATNRLPLWVVEGLAEYLSVGRVSSHTAMWMRDAVLRDDLPNLQQLSRDPSYFPYRFGHALWAYIGGTYGDDAVVELYRAAGQGRAQGFRGASGQVLGVPGDTVVSRWGEATREYYQPLLEDRTPPNATGTRILPTERRERPMALSPSVSPDGSTVAYLARRDLFTMDLFMADTRTGEVLGKLASAASELHMDALAFINSVGSWSPGGDRFAFTVFAGGDNRIAVADARRQEIVRRITIDEVGAIYSLAWSPDGGRIAFSGSTGGITDLYVLELETEDVRRLTDDAFSELHPSWSPDGTSLAFTTDRGDERNLRTLSFPRPGIGVMEVASGEIEVHRPLGDVKHIDPAYSPDGRSLYFIADRQGFSDIYRLVLETGEVRQVTRVATGVSGITGLSPALTVARGSGRVLFNVFDNGGYAIQALSSQEMEGTTLSAGEEVEAFGGVLPPREIVEPARVAEYLRDAQTGLHPPDTWSARDYDGGLQLDRITQPTVGVGVDRFGTRIGGGVAAFFSDMLGDKELAVATNINGQIEDIGAQAAYIDRGNRWNWGGQAGRIPFTTLGTRTGTVERNGQSLRAVDLIEFQTVLHTAGLRTEYPFSSTLRAEISGEFTNWSFSQEIHRTLIDDRGRVVDRENLGGGEVGFRSFEDLNIGSGSAALVLDNSFFGFTSPVRGSRARVEVEANAGSLDYASVLGDLRKYFFWNPLTLAVQGYHFGRYGGDSEDPRLTPLFLGFEMFVRGYDFNSFSGEECTSDPRNPQACPEFDRLLGSRMAVGKVELRVPLIGVERFGLLPLGFIPTELSVFGDAGVAWTDAEGPELEFDTDTPERVPVFSTGVSMRFNIVGRLIFEVYGAHPFQRPREDWVWGFTILPGF